MALEGLVAVQARIAELRGWAVPPSAPSGASTAGDASFDSVLSSVLEPPAAGTAPAAVKAAGGYGKLTPPADLAAYGNGRIPAERLALIGAGDHRLWQPAAAAFVRMQAAAAAAGVRVGVTDSYRSYDEQVAVARDKGLYRNGGLAATPGTSSHGWGLSLDLDLDSRAQAWMRENASRYGFVEDVPREPWHWTYRPSS
jgi:zinc D-Ala-D-Ala carboxypeptidase